jgi:hypothetical protein
MTAEGAIWEGKKSQNTESRRSLTWNHQLSKPAEELTRSLTGEEPTGDEPLMGIFEWALERLSSDQQGGR